MLGDSSDKREALLTPQRAAAHAADEHEPAKKDTHARMAFFMASSIIASALNTITFKHMLNAYKSQDPAHPHDYEFFVNQWNVFLYVCLASLVVLRRVCLRRSGRRWLERQRHIMPQRKVAVMGFLDGFAGFLSAVGGAYTAGNMQTLLTQTIIPWTLVFSYLFLGTRYSSVQCVGALSIMLGAATAIVPQMLAGPAAPAAGGGGGAQWVGLAIFCCSVLPQSFSNVYKERTMQSVGGVDVYFLTSCVSSWQVLPVAWHSIA
jgi:drug/metabolite transporter (DMT)-like permease